ncbi:MAG: acetyltransferase [Lachnospiraceae bacterium]
MEKVVIIGSGGHAHVIVDILQSTGAYEVVGLIDTRKDAGFWDIPVLGDDSRLTALYQQGITSAFVAIGNNQLREKLYNMVKEIGYTIVNAISPYAIISSKVQIGDGVAIMPGAVVNAGTVIGNGTIINTNASVDHDGQVGNFVHVAPGCAIAGCVSIGDKSFLGVGTRVIDQILIGKNVIVGAGASVICNVESDCTVVGVPAKKIK